MVFSTLVKSLVFSTPVKSLWHIDSLAFPIVRKKADLLFFQQVFASDPWHLAQPGSIRNLTIQTKGSFQLRYVAQKNFTITGLNAMQIEKERQSKKIKELKKEVNAVRLKGILAF